MMPMPLQLLEILSVILGNTYYTTDAKNICIMIMRTWKYIEKIKIHPSVTLIACIIVTPLARYGGACN